MPKEIRFEVDATPLAEFVKAAMTSREAAGRSPPILLHNEDVRATCKFDASPLVQHITLFPSDALLKKFADESSVKPQSIEAT
ncbi:MAG: hypothetical protein K8U03_09105 [Planctomycetia bacterium]|nr:hypothetical protein [Planctomycetia bacterium]